MIEATHILDVVATRPGEPGVVRSEDDAGGVFGTLLAAFVLAYAPADGDADGDFLVGDGDTAGESTIVTLAPEPERATGADPHRPDPEPLGVAPVISAGQDGQPAEETWVAPDNPGASVAGQYRAASPDRGDEVSHGVAPSLGDEASRAAPVTRSDAAVRESPDPASARPVPGGGSEPPPTRVQADLPASVSTGTPEEGRVAVKAQATQATTVPAETSPGGSEHAWADAGPTDEAGTPTARVSYTRPLATTVDTGDMDREAAQVAAPAGIDLVERRTVRPMSGADTAVHQQPPATQEVGPGPASVEEPQPAAPFRQPQSADTGDHAFRTALRVYRKQEDTAVMARVSSPSLGPVRVEVISGKRGVDATVFASDPASRSILAGELGSLRDTLSESGVNLRNLEVRADLPGTGGETERGGDPGDERSRGPDDPGDRTGYGDHEAGRTDDVEVSRPWAFSVMA